MNEEFESALKKEADALHFEKGWQMVQEHPSAGPAVLVLKARILRGLYRWSLAKEAASQAITSSLAGSPVWFEGRLELARNEFLLGNSRLAKQILDETMREPSFSAQNENVHVLYAIALSTLLSEQGDVDQAVSVLANVTCADISDPKVLCDLYGLQGDLASFQEKFALARSYYSQARLAAQSLPAGSYRTLRLALLQGSMADLAELEEDYPAAEKLYRSGLALLDSISDPALFDLSAYRVEMLLNLGNVLANLDDFVQAKHWLDLAREVLESGQAPVQKDNYLAKFWYLSGLWAMYRADGPDSRAADCFEQAYRLYDRLGKEKKEKAERVAMSAFYLAQMLPDDPALARRRIALLERAAAIFSRLWQREPRFFLSSIGSACNEMGRLETNADKAQRLYEAAVSAYLRAHAAFPADGFIVLSLVTSLLNLHAYAKALDWMEVLADMDQDYSAELDDLLEAVQDRLDESLKPRAARLKKRVCTGRLLA